MSSRVTVDLSSPTPPYEQIRAQISALITVGALSKGEKLPPVRALAVDLGVAAGTVGRAYKELEAAGLIESRRRHGTVVIAEPDRERQPGLSRHGAIIEAAQAYVRAGRELGLEDHTLLDIVRSQLVGDTLEP